MRVTGRGFVFIISLIVACGEEGEGVDSTDISDVGDAAAVDDAADTADICDEYGQVYPKRTAYYFVRVTDLSGGEGDQGPGAGIDAIFLTRPSGCVEYPTTVPLYEALGNDVEAADPSAVLVSDVHLALPDTSTCVLETSQGHPTYVSLGGSGYLVLQFNPPVFAGDVLTVLTTEGCDEDADTKGKEILVEIGVSPDSTGTWHTVTQGAATIHQTVITEAMVSPVEAAP